MPLSDCRTGRWQAFCAACQAVTVIGKGLITDDGEVICARCARLAMEAAGERLPVYILAATEEEAAAFATINQLQHWAFAQHGHEWRNGLRKWAKGTVKYMVVPGFHRRNDIAAIFDALSVCGAIEVDPSEYHTDDGAEREIRVKE